MFLCYRIRIFNALGSASSSISFVFQRASPPERRPGPIWPEEASSFDKSSMNPSFPKEFMQLYFRIYHDSQIGGDDRNRTGDPLLAKQVLSQLSYIPPAFFLSVSPLRKMVGLTGVEPVTSPLSGVRSNQLSYRPNPVRRRAVQHQKYDLKM